MHSGNGNGAHAQAHQQQTPPRPGHQNGRGQRQDQPPMFKAQEASSKLEWHKQLLAAVSGTHMAENVRNQIRTTFETLVQAALGYNMADQQLAAILTEYAALLKQ